jgi:hypothetical protein
VAANLIRYAMIRRLHEPCEPDESMADFMAVMGGIYDSLVSASQHEAQESWEYLSQQIVQQLLTSHTVEQTLSDATLGVQQQQDATAHTDGTPVKGVQAALTKLGAEFSAKNLALLTTAHDALADAVGGKGCADYMAKLGGDVAPPQTNQDPREGIDGREQEMNEAAVKAAVAAALAEHDAELAKNVVSGTVAVTAPVDIVGQITRALEPFTQELAGLGERLGVLENRPLAGDTTFVTAVNKVVETTERDRRRAALVEKVARAEADWLDSSDHAVRADRFRTFASLRAQLQALDAAG